MKRIVLTFYVAMCCFILSASGQDWNYLTITVPAKAELASENYRTIIIAEILNDRNRVDEYTRDLYDELANRIFEIDDLILVDRQKTESLLSEFEFQQSSGLVNEGHITELGKFYSSGIITFIRIQTAKYNDQVISTQKWAVVNGCGTLKHRETSFELSVNFKLIDLQTGSVVFSKTIDALPKRKSKGYDCTTPPKFNKEEIYREGLEIIGSEFRKLFEDHEKEYILEFQKYSKINDDLRKAITYFKINEWQTGYGIMESISQKDLNDRAQSAALYNLALIQLYTGRISESLLNAKKAYVLNPNNQACLIIIETLE